MHTLNVCMPFEYAARRVPDKAFLLAGPRQLSYADVDQRTGCMDFEYVTHQYTRSNLSTVIGEDTWLLDRLARMSAIAFSKRSSTS